MIADLHDDDDVQMGRVGHRAAKTTAQIDDGNDDAAQIEHAANVIGLPRQLSGISKSTVSSRRVALRLENQCS